MTPIKAVLIALALFAPGMARAATPAADAPVVYTVQPKDTLYGLGQKFFLDPNAYHAVQKLNGVTNARRMHVGKELIIPYALLKFEPTQAVLAAFRGTVTITVGERPATVAQGMTIPEGAVLATGPDAFLTIEFEDGSRTTLPSRSRLKIERMRKIVITGAVDRVLNLQAGRGGASVRPLSSPRDRFIITTPLAVAAVRGTEFRVVYDEERERSALEVVEGKVAGIPQDERSEVLTAAGFGLLIGKTGEPLLAPLLPAPKLNNSSRPQEAATVGFEVAAVPGARSYRGQLANDAGFIDIIAEDVFQTTALPFGVLADGTYFARLTAIDEAGLEGLPSTYAFERQLATFDPSAPAAEDGPGRRYRFRWYSAGSAAERYRFQLSQSEDGSSPLIDEPGLTEKQIVITDLPPGVYYWRVLITRTRDGKQTERWSEPQRFELGL